MHVAFHRQRRDAQHRHIVWVLRQIARDDR
jgi:hypothetical protein